MIVCIEETIIISLASLEILAQQSTLQIGEFVTIFLLLLLQFIYAFKKNQMAKVVVRQTDGNEQIEVGLNGIRAT